MSKMNIYDKVAKQVEMVGIDWINDEKFINDIITRFLADKPNPTIEECKVAVGQWLMEVVALCDKTLDEAKKDYTEEEWAQLEREAEEEYNQEQNMRFLYEMSKSGYFLSQIVS